MDKERPYAEAFYNLAAESSDSDTRNIFAGAIEKYEKSNKSFDERVKLALAVQRKVNQFLDFRSLKQDKSSTGLSPGDIISNGSTNCYGNVIVVSEILEDVAAIEHYVAFVNQHAFVWLYDHASRESFMVDMRPSLSLYTSNSVMGEPPMEWQISGGSTHHDMAIDPRRLVAEINNKDDHARAEMSPWLGMNPFTKYFRNDYGDDFTLPMRIYPSLPGREILELYHNSVTSVNRGDIDSAVDVIGYDMYGVYPDIDPQNKLEFVQKTIDYLLSVGKIDRALDVAKSISSSLPEWDKTHQSFIYPDVLRQAGVKTGDSRLVDEAIRLYDEAEHGGGLRTGKIVAARKELARLAGEEVIYREG